jgi:hypothetical protein
VSLDKATPFIFAAFRIMFWASLVFPMDKSHLTDSGRNLPEEKRKTSTVLDVRFPKYLCCKFAKILTSFRVIFLVIVFTVTNRY